MYFSLEILTLIQYTIIFWRRRNSQVKERNIDQYGHGASSYSDNQVYQLDQCPAYKKVIKPTSSTSVEHTHRAGGRSEDYQLSQYPAYGELINTTVEDETVYYYTVYR